MINREEKKISQQSKRVDEELDKLLDELIVMINEMKTRFKGKVEASRDILRLRS
jgi:hypothetical protein